ncbi:ComEC/Rec2 family competence protein [Streptomyces sp. NPDC059618]|uniref:ComEC/Rec2 family competence protein n=1 Tax=Streptomyces sp. NPDC059618 TaxID=3346887 RepID=UPI0036A29089
MTDSGGIEGGGKRKRVEDEPEPVGELDAEAEVARRKALKAEEEETASMDVERLTGPPGGPPRGGGNGRLSVMYLDAGQGDCTLITTPAGRHIMIDCGHDNGSPEVDFTGTETSQEKSAAKKAANTRRKQVLEDAVNGAGFLNGGTHLDILVITHPDDDHNNTIAQVLGGKTIGSVYFSGKYGTHLQNTQTLLNRRQTIQSPLTDPNKPADWTEATFPGTPKAVFCRWADPKDRAKGTEVRIDMFGKAGAAGDPKQEGVAVDIQDGAGIKILVETDCTVSVIAGNVQRDDLVVIDSDALAIDDGDTDGKNCGSLVVLIEAFGKKLLFCGDATRSTEQFLIAKHGARLADTDWLRVAHHGSAGTSSIPDFISTVRPKNVVISAGRQYSTGFKHPRWLAVKRYLTWFAKDPAAGNVPVVLWRGESLTEKAAPPPADTDRADQAKVGMRSLTPVADRVACYTAVVGHPVHATPKAITVDAKGITEDTGGTA